MSKVWFTADQHFRHPNILRFCGRPFASIEEHDAALVRAWRERVEPGDRVYVLGDFCWAHSNGLLDQLPGQLYLIKGNHDRRDLYRHSRWIWCKGWKVIKINGQHIMMCHFPLVTWPGKQRGQWMLHGHVHNGIGHDKLERVTGRFDVGVDGNPHYAPWSFEELTSVVPRTEERFGA